MTRTAAQPTSDREVLILDGGLSNALADRGHDLSGPLWTARLLRDAPEEIAAVHRRYYEAGARVATTASYQASVPSLVQHGVERREAERLITRSVTLARTVRDELAGDGVRRWVAASVGPYGAVLADGSEYRGRYGLGRDALRDFHGPRLELLAAAGPDFFAVETIPDVDEAEVLLELLDELQLPGWLSYAVAGGRTRAGQPLSAAFQLAGSADTVFAVGVNCCPPGDVLDAARVAAGTGRPVVAYPNSGEQWDPVGRRWRGPGGYDLGLVPAWINAGVRWVGGCCRVGPDVIARLADSAAVG